MRVESRGGAGVELVQEVDALCKGRTPSDLVDFSQSDLQWLQWHLTLDPHSLSHQKGSYLGVQQISSETTK